MKTASKFNHTDITAIDGGQSVVHSAPPLASGNVIEITNTLRQMSFICDVDDDTLNLIARRAVKKFVTKGQYLFIEGDALTSFSILISGRIKIFKQTPYGRFVTITILRGGGTYGDMALFDGEPLSVSAVALEDVSILSIDRTRFLQIVEHSPSLATALILNISRRYKEAQERVVNLAAYDARHRIPRILANLFQQHGNCLLLTHQEIADIAGTNRENTSRVLEHLRSIGAIGATRGRLELCDTAKLLDNGSS